MKEAQVLEQNAKVYFISEKRIRQIDSALGSATLEPEKCEILKRHRITFERRFKCAGQLLEENFLTREDLLPLLNQHQITLP